MSENLVASAGVRGWWGRSFSGLPRPFWVLFAGTIVNRVGQFVQPFLSLYLVGGRDLSVATAGTLVSCFGAGLFVSPLLGGWLADRFGRRPTLIWGLVATAAGLAALGLADQLWTIAVCAFALGVAMDVYRPAIGAAVAEIVDPADRPRAFGLIYWAVNIGVSISGVLGGLLAERGWWLLFVLDALTCLVFAVLVARGVPESRAPRSEQDTSGYGEVLRDRLLLVLAAVTLAGACVYIQAYVALPLAMRADGLSPARYGLAYAVNPVLIIAVQPLTFPALRLLPPVPLYVGSILVLGTGFFLTGFAHSTAAYALTVGVWTIGEIGFNAVAPSIINAISPDRLRGRYNGVIGLAYGGSAFIGPILGAHALQAGRWTVWGGALVVSLVSAAAAAALGPALGRRMARSAGPA
ncbi:MFS transporter [Angustibacter sp. McL0619]|uniref:MFS transporter n=1 Tax=Angustibacter sp. McL0619 TaxID=3415676 RepID=UPI003CF80115